MGTSDSKLRTFLRINVYRWINLERGDKNVLIRLYETIDGREWREGHKECGIKNNRVVSLVLQYCNLRGKFENETTTTIFTL